MPKKADNSSKSGKASAKQKSKNEVLRMVDFFFDSLYDIVTWVAIACCIGFGIYFLSQHNWRGLMWSFGLLLCSIIIMIAIRADQSFFRTTKAGESQARPRLSIEKVFMQTMEAGKPEAVRMVTKNRGSLIANKVKVFNTIAHLASDFPGPLVHAAEPPEVYGSVEPGTDLIFEFRSKWTNLAPDIAAINASEILVFSYGKIEYEDESGTPYALDYCFTYEPSTPEKYLAICPTKYLPVTDAAKTPQSVIDRPYIWPLEITPALELGQHPAARVTFRNSGKTPAINFESQIAMYVGPILPEPLEFPALREPPSRVAVVHPDAKPAQFVVADTITTTSDFLRKIQTGERLIYVLGKGQYEDTRGKSYKFTYYSVFEPAIGQFKLCPKYNDAG